MTLLLGIDEGTSAVKAILFDAELRPIREARREKPLDHPKPGWVEQDPQVVLDAVVGAVAELPAMDADAELVQLRGDAERLQHFERRRMKRARAQIHEELGIGLEHEDWNIAQRETEGRDEADRPGSDDDDPVTRWRHPRRFINPAGAVDRSSARRP